MLEGLDKIDWKNLEHAYGEASDVPDLIRSLASNNIEEREDALWELYGNIFHQGTRYEATRYAIPFIFELIREPDITDKSILIRFTIDLALGYHEAFLPRGPNVENWIEDAGSFDAEDEEEKAYWIRHIDAFIDSYKATLKEVPTYLECLKNSEQDVKLTALFALAWFREEAQNTSEIVLSILRNEKNELLIMNALISLSMLDSYNDIRSHIDEIHDFFSNESNLIKIASSIALINILQDGVDAKFINFLINELPIISKMEMNPSDFPWNDGDILGFISEVLKFYAIENPEKIVIPLCNILKNLTGEQSLNLTSSLLWMVFPVPPEGSSQIKQKVWTLKELNKYQKRVLKTLVDNPNIWKLEDIDFENFNLLMKEYNLPSTISDLRKLLGLDLKK
ncbi:MAG: hypothetical protein KGD73_03625 [Candidatus Lokiarchaeota archaeon]|nr:hypothetical protein [Candidatus Lokiarchaeota archaeon]